MRHTSNQDKLFAVLQHVDEKWTDDQLDDLRCGRRSYDMKMGQFVEFLRDRFVAAYPDEKCILPPYLKYGVARRDGDGYTVEEIYDKPPPKRHMEQDLVRFRSE